MTTTRLPLRDALEDSPRAGFKLASAARLPVLPGLTPHGLRHGLQTSYEDGIPGVLKTEQMGHELPGMHGICDHVSPAMRANLNRLAGALGELAPRTRGP